MISIVIPIFNEEESIQPLYKEIQSALKGRELEIIFVDDGSTDGSLEVLKKLLSEKSVQIFSFRKNHGKAEALTLGFSKANGDYVVTLDADLQDKPDQIEKMLKIAQSGYDLVCGWRKDRKDSLGKKLSSKLFNYIAGLLWGINLHDYNCGLKVYSQEVTKQLNLYGGMHRFIPLLTYEQGFRVTEVPVVHESRRYGSSKFGFSKLWRDLPDIFTMLFLSRYRSRPLHFFSLVGSILFFSGIIILSYLAYIKVTVGDLGPRPSLFLGMILVLTGFQVFLTGFLADLFTNLMHSQDRKFPLKYSSEQS